MSEYPIHPPLGKVEHREDTGAEIVRFTDGLNRPAHITTTYCEYDVERSGIYVGHDTGSPVHLTRSQAVSLACHISSWLNSGSIDYVETSRRTGYPMMLGITASVAADKRFTGRCGVVRNGDATSRAIPVVEVAGGPRQKDAPPMPDDRGWTLVVELSDDTVIVDASLDLSGYPIPRMGELYVDESAVGPAVLRCVERVVHHLFKRTVTVTLSAEEVM